MAEYINRASLINHLNTFAPEHYNSLVNDLILKESAADVVERKKGKWMQTDAFPHHVYCSVCHKTYIPNSKWSIWKNGELPREFCPNCGADMRGET